VNVTVQPRVSFRLLGRSFLAFVLAPERPLEDWLMELDGKLKSSVSFFANRPIVLDLTSFAPTKMEAEDLVAHLEYRDLRLIAVEGVAADWLPERLAPIPGVMQPVGMFAPKEDSQVLQPEPPQIITPRQHIADGDSKCATLLIDEPVRSGQIITYLEGDVTVVGSVASGAEIIAGGSIHVYGALRGRAFAGASGNSGARIFCNRFDAEILVIDGLYQTADDFDRSLHGTQVQARLDHGIMNIRTMN
jgi:septum site-determining protein MinC